MTASMMSSTSRGWSVVVRIGTFFLVAAILLLPAARTGYAMPVASPAQSVPFQVIARWDAYSMTCTNACWLVITSQQQFDEFWRNSNGGSPPAVDFSRDAVLVAGWGGVPTGSGDSVRLTEVTRIGSDVRVHVRRERQPFFSSTTARLQRPWTISTSPATSLRLWRSLRRVPIFSPRSRRSRSLSSHCFILGRHSSFQRTEQSSKVPGSLKQRFRTTSSGSLSLPTAPAGPSAELASVSSARCDDVRRGPAAGGHPSRLPGLTVLAAAGKNDDRE